MALRELLIEREAAVCGRWLDAILAEYGALTATRWRKEKDAFANPVGHALTAGLPVMFEALVVRGEVSAEAVSALEDIVRIRSVQELSPGRAVGFVFLLRDAVRQELAAELEGGAHAGALAALDARLERLALLGFDAYVGFREQVYRLRQEELKRSVGSILRRWHGGELPESDPDLVRLDPPPDPGHRR
jgi:hypothetical protein